MEPRPPVCASFHPRLEAWAAESLPEAERQTIAAHLAACPGCRAAAQAIDPSALFLQARGGNLPESFWTPFDAALRARLAAESRRPVGARLAARVAATAAETRAAFADAWRPAVWLAPAAVAMMVLVTLAVLRPVPPPQLAQGPRVDGLPSPYAPPRARIDAPSGSPAASGSVGAVPIPTGDTLTELPALEAVASPSARVYRFDAPGQDAAPIYFVVDESIEF